MGRIVEGAKTGGASRGAARFPGSGWGFASRIHAICRAFNLLPCRGVCKWAGIACTFSLIFSRPWADSRLFPRVFALRVVVITVFQNPCAGEYPALCANLLCTPRSKVPMWGGGGVRPGWDSINLRVLNIVVRGTVAPVAGSTLPGGLGRALSLISRTKPREKWRCARTPGEIPPAGST